jgi:hypothetical protein
VSTLDTLLLEHILWYDPSDKDKVRNFLWSVVVPESDIQGIKFIVDRRLTEESVDLCDSIARGVDQSSVASEAESTLELAAVENLLAKKAVEFMVLKSQILYESVADNISKPTSTTTTTSHSKPQTQLHWWSDADATAMRQQLVPQVNRALREITSLGSYVSGLLSVLRDEQLSDEERASLMDQVVGDRESYSASAFSGRKNVGIDLGGDFQFADTDDGDGDDDDMDTNSDMEKWASMSKKEAQKKLSSEQFKQWKTAQKMSRKKNKDDPNS